MATRQVRKYTTEFRREAITLALKSPSISRTAQELGVPVGTLHSWIKSLKDHPKPAEGLKQSEPNIAALIEENRRLHKELAVTKEEKEILKKAAAYFAQHQK